MKRYLTTEEINDILDTIQCTVPNTVVQHSHEQFRKALVKELQSCQIYPDMIPKLSDTIQKRFFHALAPPGENVGILAAQSIGERQTQLSISPKHRIVLYHKHTNHHYSTTIGEFIDSNISTGYIDLGNGSRVKPIKGYEICSLSKEEEIKWMPISEISRHPPNGDLIRIITEKGHTVTSTLSHSHLCRDEKHHISPIEGRLLKVGDRIPIQMGVTEYFPKSIVTSINRISYFIRTPLYDTESDVPRDQLKEFVKHIQSHPKYPLLKYTNDYKGLVRALRSPVEWVKIDHIEIIPEKEIPFPYVYDFSVPETETFMIDRGVFVHNTLDTFHSTGVTTSTVVTGVPRFAELLSATKNPNNNRTIICTTVPHTTISGIRDDIGHRLTYLVFEDIVKDIRFGGKERKPWYDAYDTLHSNSYEACEKHIEITIDPFYLFKHRISMYSIYQAVSNEFSDIHCVYSPMPQGIVDIWYETPFSMKLTPEEEVIIPPDHQELYYVNGKILPAILKIPISGIEGIGHIRYIKQPDTGIFMIQAVGSNMIDVIRLDGIDPYKTYSNNIWVLYELLGIEAVREFLITEFLEIISVDSYINKIHVELLVDCMIHTGTISSVSRTGVTDEHFDMLSRASFERSMDHFVQAAFNGEIDPTDSISSSIFCGKVSRTGSGICDLLYTPSL